MAGGEKKSFKQQQQKVDDDNEKNIWRFTSQVASVTEKPF